MEQNVRLSHQGLRLLRFMMDQPRISVAGVDVARAVGIGSGTLYPLLNRLEIAGWLSSELEEIDPSVEKRPKRRLYKLTAHGQNCANTALRELSEVEGIRKWV